MRAVVGIHNAVNERAWQEVLAWERLHSAQCDNPRLKRFMGRPSDLSPKARLLNFLVSTCCRYTAGRAPRWRGRGGAWKGG